MTHIYRESEFKNIKNEYYNLSLDRTDKNGTRYFTGLQKCWKCGGAKVFVCWGHIDGGVCWACNGTGVNPCGIKVMTDAHADKLDAKKQKRQEAKIQDYIAHTKEINASFLAKEGFNADGKAWVVIKTGFVKKEFADQMKELGAKKINFNIYIFSHKVDGFDCIEIDAEDCMDKDMYGGYNGFKSAYLGNLLVQVQEKERQALAEKSAYFGEVGQKVELDLVFKNLFFYETQFGGMCLYIFEDAEGHQFKWNTSSGFGADLEEGCTIKVKATIKEHSEYKGIKQTVLIRCKLM